MIRAYPDGDLLFSIRDINEILDIYIANNKRDKKTIEKVGHFFNKYYIFRKEQPNEVVLKGREILEAIFQEYEG